MWSQPPLHARRRDARRRRRGTRSSGEWLPNEADETYIKSLMKPVYERGKMANWIAPPRKGINGLPVDFEYVKL